MPQATLLSYFSRPPASTPAQNSQRSGTGNPGQGHQDSKNISIGVPATNGLGVTDKIRSFSIKTSPLTGDASRDANVHGRHTTESGEEKNDPNPSRVLSPLEDKKKVLCVTEIVHLPEAIITHVSEHHLPSIRRLTSTTLPVRYGDAFFTTTLTDPIVSQLSRVVLYASAPVGWIRCLLEPCSPKSTLSQIYIQALALLSPYRNLGLATLLLETILSSSIAQAQSTVCIYAHVWEKNEDALEWYAKRGFRRVMLVERYYRRLRPGGAWIVRREVDGS